MMKRKRENMNLYPGKYDSEILNWLKNHYGESEGQRIFQETKKTYQEYLKEAPEYGGKKNGHSTAIYGGLLVFALYHSLPDHPPVSELQDFVQNLFMKPFVILGKIFDLNRSFDMKLIDLVFQKTGDRDRKDILKYPAGFINVNEPYDSVKQISRYHFLRCPNAEFAKKKGMTDVLPVLCNCDYFGIRFLHGTLIREGTCGISDRCDYCIVGDRNPLTAEYEIMTDDNGLLISRKKTLQ